MCQSIPAFRSRTFAHRRKKLVIVDAVVVADGCRRDVAEPSSVSMQAGREGPVGKIAQGRIEATGFEVCRGSDRDPSHQDLAPIARSRPFAKQLLEQTVLDAGESGHAFRDRSNTSAVVVVRLEESP